MNILNVRTITGPNVYQKNPVLVLELQLERHSLEDELITKLIEKTVVELSEKAGIPIEEAQFTKDKVIVSYKNEEATIFLLKSAVEIVDKKIHNLTFDYDQYIAEALMIIQKYTLSPSTAALLKAAEHRNIPWMHLKDQNLIQLGWGKHRKFIQAIAAITPGAGYVDSFHGNDVLDKVFENQNGRIPVIAITGTNGKTTCSRLLNHIFTTDGKCVGNTTSDGINIGNELVEEGDTTGPISARMILSNPHVDIAVLETARGGIVKRGLAFDACDIAIFTNVNADHIGQDGIESIEDIIKIKSLIVKQVKSGGTVILSADCKNVSALIHDEQYTWKNKKVIFISLDESNPVLKNHLENGGHGYFFRKGEIIEVIANQEKVVAHTADIPLTMNGTAHFHVWNSMAAIAAAHTMKVSEAILTVSLSTFSQANNPGRTNLYRIKSGHLMMDFGHNPDAFHAIGKMAGQWNVSKITGVIAAPGDRSDDMIRMTGEYAAHAFEKIIIREDEDKRGRKDGETGELLLQTIKELRPEMDCKMIQHSRTALQTALDEMVENELVIFFYDYLSETDDILKENRACPLVSPSLFKKPLNDVFFRTESATERSYNDTDNSGGLFQCEHFA